jgi:hypothetical protein
MVLLVSTLSPLRSDWMGDIGTVLEAVGGFFD